MILSKRIRKRVEELPTILCADRFFMTDEAMKTFEGVGKVIWVDCKSEEKVVEKLRNANINVIICARGCGCDPAENSPNERKVKEPKGKDE